MARIEAVSPAAGRVLSGGWRVDLPAAIAVACVMVVVQAASGFPTLHNSGGDNDSLMRLVQIRDWLAGQGWSDLMQYRMGPEGGFLMHWSRIVDLPVAAIMVAVGTLTGSMATGEAIAAVLWPAVLFAVAMWLLLSIARRQYGDEAFLPMLVVGGITLNFMGIFTPRALDHHNLQLVLLLAVIALLLVRSSWSAFVAGLCAATMLAVGLETLPYVAVAGTVAALAFLVLGGAAASFSAGYGLGFAGAALVLLLATVPASSWWIAACDAYSAGLTGVAIVAGAGLAAVALTTASRSLPVRLAGLAILAAITVAAAVTLTPACLADPYAGLDPELRAFWLDSVVEAQPLWRILERQPKLAPQNYATVLIALVLLVLEMRRRLAFGPVVMFAFLLSAFAVSVWQVRGSTFSLTLATVPLAGWIALWRARAAAREAGAVLRMALTWVLSLSMAWGAAAHGIADLMDGGRQKAMEATARKTDCYADADYAILASQPRTTVLAISNLGSSILANTDHRTLAGPYHRNVAGNLAALRAFMGTPEEARAIVEAQRVGLVAFCPGNGESGSLAGLADSGLMAELTRGEVPQWLEPVAGSEDQALRLYRVR